MDLVSYLSGNVPGGIYLYLAVVIVTLIILFFMHRVNELFTRKHFFRWSILVIILYSVIYTALWFRNPPPHHLRRYAIVFSEKERGTTWFSNYLGEILSRRISPYVSEREYFFPASWFYRVTPPDSGSSLHFRRDVATKLPIHTVLSGEVERLDKSFHVKIEIVRFPSQNVIHRAENDFSLSQLNEFPQWVSEECADLFPFQKSGSMDQVAAPDSLLEKAKIRFYQGRYEECLRLLNSRSGKKGEDSRYDIWRQSTLVKLAGAESLHAPQPSRFIKELPDWQRRLTEARNRLIDYVRQGATGPNLDVVIAESHIWEKDFASAEIFLEKAYIENPFNIDVLLNLTYLYKSRYQEFGFSGISEIYERILNVCPIEEKVLLVWVENILENNPSYSAPPKYARKRLEEYLLVNPHSVNAWLMLGKVFAQGLDRQKTLEAFQKADSIAPANAAVQYNLGVLYYEWNKPDIAEDYLRKAIELDDYLDAYLYLGVILMEKGDYREALEKFRYRVSRKQGENDFYAYQAMKGIQQCLEAIENNTEK